MPKFSNYALTMALLAHSGGVRVAYAVGCDGVIASLTGECDFASFQAALSDDCNVDVLFPSDPEAPSTPQEQVAELCAYDAPVQFFEIQGSYQDDRRYFAGGGHYVDGEDLSLEMAQLDRFQDHLGGGASDTGSTLIAFPEYAARVQYNIDNLNVTNGYPANMNLESSCGLKTIMCCFTDGDFAVKGDATTDVCRHDLHDSPQSNHIKEGWYVVYLTSFLVLHHIG